MPYLEKAIKAHYPNSFMVKKTFQRVKKFGMAETIDEFEKSWKEFISDAGKRVFFCFYDIEGIQKKADKINGMSRAEYAKLQRYADSHETIDWEAIERERIESEAVQEEEHDINLEEVNVDIDLGEL